ncbi:MAG: acetyl-CoA carboxylase, carboxyltransferase subunit beta [Alphaproteobacteria bacterium]
MNWLTHIIRPKIRSLVEQKDVPDNLWQKCPSCEGMLFTKDLEASMNVCTHCGHHMHLKVKDRLKIMFDDGRYERIELPDAAFDPLKFKDKKRYTDRLRESRNKTGLKEAITLAAGTIGGQNTVIAAFNFSFMGGSMGAGVGEGIVRGAEEAVRRKAAYIVVPASGGARMQEGMLSLIQMPRSIIAVEMVKEASLPYIVLLTNPTTGGVSASFAMVGDIHIAEPGAMIGFAGRRVIEETVRETLPADFQTAEYLKEHGMVDMVVPRKDLYQTLSRILLLLMNKKTAARLQKPGNGKTITSLNYMGSKPGGGTTAKNNNAPAAAKKATPAKPKAA